MDIAIDTGGTFTDCVYLRNGRMQVLKVFSTGDDPSQALLHGVRQCVEAAALAEPVRLRHGTTVGTNALLERKGARVAFVTTAGFEDTIAIGRQARARLYDWFATPSACIIPAELRFGVKERTAADGTVLRSPTEEDLAELTSKIDASGAESIALSLLFSFANPHNERLVAAALRRLGKPLSSSHIILPEFREYERASTVCVNAYLAPKVGAYLGRISKQLSATSAGSRFEVMQSSGGIVPADFAAERPVRTVLSGPAGGVMGAYFVARQAGFDKIIGFDMGGTSTDVALIDAAGNDGPVATNEAVVSGIPISVPMLDIHTVGAGGGSIARFDKGGILHVGPESAGANPGPICYGKGTEPTVSDANVILGRIRPEHFLGGIVTLDAERARSYADACRKSIPTVYEFAAGIIRIAESTMESAIRVISVERGHNPRDFTLVAFGGAGPLHACGLARALRIPRVLVPKLPGALSAAGILLADTVRDYSKTVMLDSAADLEPHFAELEACAEADAAIDSAYDSAASITTRSLDVRYTGQGFELNVPATPGFVQAFHAAHNRRYGYSDETRAIEIVNVRARTTIPSNIPATTPLAVTPGQARQAILAQSPVMFDREWLPANIYHRDLLRPGDVFAGAAIVVEYSATTVLPPGCSARVDAYENLVIEVPS